MKTAFRLLPLRSLRLCGILLLFALTTAAQNIPAPKDTLGFTPGDDRKLANWAQIVDYFKKLDAASDRMVFEEIGKTTMGAPFVYATISSPENLKNLEKYKGINANLADPRKIGTRTLLSARSDSREKAAQQLIAQGKTIVLITCGIHSTEVGSTLSSMLIAHKLATSSDPEIQNVLKNTIILLVPSLNPDGVDIVKNWYDKTLGTPHEGTEPPELYHKYVGHDNNRDWYAFTQVETQLTVDKIHNVWHPQIVHDIHQQGANGARLFLPPYMAPVEPNVPKQIVEGYTELGNFMAADLRKKGLEGITTNTTYDAWTPARAYSHYHGGVRILSETASAKLATPITVKFEDLRGASGGLDAKKKSPNFGPVWKGGEWKLRNITDYMTTAAFSLLNHAADNRERWLSRFYEIGKEAVRPRKNGEINAFIIPQKGHAFHLFNILKDAGVETRMFGEFKLDGSSYPDGTEIVLLDQPYGAFAKAILERQKYPDLLDEKGQPIAPYDVTAHTLPLLTGTEVVAVSKPFNLPKSKYPGGIGSGQGCEEYKGRDHWLYRSHIPSMDEGWTRWIAEQRGYLLTDKVYCNAILKTASNRDIRSVRTGANLKTIIFPDQSPNQILNGYPKGSMPDEYTGGVGKEGVENLRKFVEAGGTLVFLNRASNFAIEQFNLPVKDVTKGLARKDFFIPGSILRTELDLTHPIAKGMPQQSIAWFENSPAFEIITDPLAGVSSPLSGVRSPTVREGSTGQTKALTDVRTTDTVATAKNSPPCLGGVDAFRGRGGSSENALVSFNYVAHTQSCSTTPSAEASATPPNQGGEFKNIRIIAKYPSDPKNILLSGWALGAEKIAGKAALVEISMGKGKIILFGFRPQYRGQSLATFPLLFNAISN